MTTLSEFLTVIRGYTGFLDPDVQSDAYLTAFVRQMEQRTSKILRIADNVQIDTATIYQQRVQVPSDWQANDFVRGPDGKGLRFKARQEFYELESGVGYFTQTGRWLIIGGTPDAVDGKSVELAYFGDVPQLTDDEMEPSWLIEDYLEVAIDGTMMFASVSMADSSVDWEGKFNEVIRSLNDKYTASKSAGGTIARRTGSFG